MAESLPDIYTQLDKAERERTAIRARLTKLEVSECRLWDRLIVLNGINKKLFNLN